MQVFEANDFDNLLGGMTKPRDDYVTTFLDLAHSYLYHRWKDPLTLTLRIRQRSKKQGLSLAVRPVTPNLDPVEDR